MLVSPFDIAIILISSIACIYCMVLSRRLRALQNTRNGLGATIKALSDSISAVSATTDETRYHAGELATRLAHLIEEAKTSCARVEGLMRDAPGMVVATTFASNIARLKTLATAADRAGRSVPFRPVAPAYPGPAPANRARSGGQARRRPPPPSTSSGVREAVL